MKMRKKYMKIKFCVPGYSPYYNYDDETNEKLPYTYIYIYMCFPMLWAMVPN